MAPQARPAAPGYAKWRRSVREASALLEATYEEIHYYIQERSPAWFETERAGDLEADKDTLYEVMELIDELSVGRSRPYRRREPKE